MKKQVSLLLGILMLFLLILPAQAQVPEQYAAGQAFGAMYAQDIRGNIQALYQAAEEKAVDKAALTEHALGSAEACAELLPGKIDWMRGVAAGAGIPYADIAVFNFSDKLVGGLYGECTTFMANGKYVAGGGTIIAKNRDQSIQTLSEVTVEEAARYTKDDLYQAAYIQIPQMEETYRFTGSRTAGRWGYGMGVNEHGVSASDNDANSRDYLQFDKSLHDNDVIRLILERAKTAREGVDVVASLVEEYGQAWNGIMFEIGDKDELWIVEVTGKRWAAKLYKDAYTARSNQFQLRDDYDLASPDLISFAAEMGWAEAGAEKIDFTAAYSSRELYPSSNDDIATRESCASLYNTQVRYDRAMELLEEALAIDGTISPRDMTAFVRDHFDTYTLPSGKVVDMQQIPFYSSDLCDWYGREWYVDTPGKDTIEVSIYLRAPCSHDLGWGATSATGILVTQPDVPGMMLHSYMPPCMGTFVPFFPLQTQVDERYSTPEAASVYNTIATKSFGFYSLFYDGVREAFDPYENSMFQSLENVTNQYQALVKAGEKEAAAQLLTAFSMAQQAAAYEASQQALQNMQDAAVENSSW